MHNPEKASDVRKQDLRIEFKLGKIIFKNDADDMGSDDTVYHTPPQKPLQSRMDSHKPIISRFDLGRNKQTFIRKLNRAPKKIIRSTSISPKSPSLYSSSKKSDSKSRSNSLAKDVNSVDVDDIQEDDHYPNSDTNSERFGNISDKNDQELSEEIEQKINDEI